MCFVFSPKKKNKKNEEVLSHNKIIQRERAKLSR